LMYAPTLLITLSKACFFPRDVVLKVRESGIS
jgi:hypothetical protein